MMGAGKTEVGELLAEQLGYEFLDTDSVVEKKAGKPIAKIFEADGEPAFRALEKEVVKSLTGSKSTVISVGGGAPVDPENRKVLKRLGLMIYLKASAQELYYRIKNDRTRPLMRTGDPLAQIQKLLAAREEVYKEADFVVDTEDLSVDEVADHLIDELAKRTVETQME
ncbi:shikimate kinase [Candidatus Poribacteria bacterium]|nr:shikimate kinase [Candidatus Poribacteria bacterium]